MRSQCHPIIDEAKKEAATIKKEALLQAKENLLKTKTEFEKDSKEGNLTLDNLDGGCGQKEEKWIEGRLASQKETNIENREKGL